jgi:mRNA interferase RelE/StbE
VIVKFLNSFSRDLNQIQNLRIKSLIIKMISTIEISNHLNEISGIKKLKGHKSAYRIRIGDYRIGLFYEKNHVELARIVHRKDIYNLFP